MEDFFNTVYNSWIDEVIYNFPLRVSRNRDADERRMIEEAIRVNQNLAGNVYALRRLLELQTQPPLELPTQPPPSLPSRTHSTTPLGILLQTFLGSFWGDVGSGLDDPTTFEDVKVTLTREQFEALDDVNVSHGECSVCMDDLSEGQEVKRLPCRHAFHRECIYNWLCRESTKCPVCRTDTRVPSSEM